MLYAETYDEAESIINRQPAINGHSEASYALHKALNYVNNTILNQFRTDSKRYCFVIDVGGYPATDLSIGAVPSLKENDVVIGFSYNRGNSNADKYTLLATNALCEQAVIGGGRYNFGDFIVKNIFSNSEQRHIIISSSGLKKLPDYFGKIYNMTGQDYDNDGIADPNEINLKLVKVKEDGLIVYPSFAEIQKIYSGLFYVEAGLERFKNDMEIDTTLPNYMRTVYVLPIISDPTEPDSDDDGLLDFEDYYPLCIKLTNVFFYDSLNKSDGKHISFEEEVNLLILNTSLFHEIAIPFSSAHDFRDKWNLMTIAPNGKKYLINSVYIISHGTPLSLTFEDSSKLFADDIYDYCKDYDNTKNINITDLDDIKINNLVFISCNSGNIDFIINDNSLRFNSKEINYGEKYSVYDEESQSYKTVFLNNLAVSYLSTHNNTINVYGADGYVQYVCGNINVIKKNEGSEYILAAGTDRWSLERNGKTRSPQNWVKYYEENNIVKYTTNIIWKKIAL